MLKSALSDMSTRELLFLVHNDVWSYCYWYQDSRCVVPDHSEVPWFLAVTLATCSAKHVFQDRRMPEMKSLALAVNELENKVKWQYVFKDESTTSTRFSKKKFMPTPPCNKVLPPEVSAFCSHLRQALLQAGQAALTRQLGRRRWWCNVKVHHLLSRQW